MHIPHLDAFLDMLVAERGASKNTLIAYEKDLLQAAAYTQKKGVSLDAAESQHMTGFFSSLKNFAPRTRARKLSTLRQYFRFLLSEGNRKDDPCETSEAPKLARALPHVLGHQDMEKLLQSAAGKKPEQLRLRALMELAYGSGLRVSELVTLPLYAFSEKRRVLLVRGKGNKERMVPLSIPALDALKDYMAVRGTWLSGKEGVKKAASPFLFPSRGKEGHLTRIRFYQMLKDAACKAGVDPHKVHPHNLRHAFATHVLEGGADLRSLQHMLGHADIATTQIYTHLAEGHLRKAVETHHPLAKKKRLGSKS